MINPKICIIFNGGAMGDFLTTLLLQQIRKEFDEIKINSKGAVVVLNSPIYDFRSACVEFLKSNMNPNMFHTCRDLEIVNSHLYVKEMSILFPDCKFYFIDDTEYQDFLCNVYIKKRALAQYPSLIEWFRSNHFSFSKIKKISDKNIIHTLKYDHARNTKDWKSLGLYPIDVSDIPNKEKCRNLIRNMLQLQLNEELFSKTFDKWAEKNTYIIEHIKT